MEFTSSQPDPNARFHVVESIFYDDIRIGVMDDERVVEGTVARGQVTGFRVEWRTSFKHPVPGLLMGAALVGVPLMVVKGDLLAVLLSPLASPMKGGALWFLFFMGLYLIWNVLRRREEPWLVFTTPAGEKALPLPRALSEEALGVLEGLVRPEEEAAETSAGAPRGDTFRKSDGPAG